MSATVSAPATTSTWAIDAKHSLIEFTTRHMMVTTVKGQFTGIEGSLVLNEANPAASSVSVMIDPASLTTRESQRDAHLRSADFLDVETFPEITFISTRVEVRDDEHLRVTGDLTLHGVTRPVVIDVTLEGRGVTPFGTAIAAFSGRTQFNRSDFGLTWNVALESGGVLVSDTIKVSLEIQAVRT